MKSKKKNKYKLNLKKNLSSSVSTLKKIIFLEKNIQLSVNKIVKSVQSGGKIMICGNGGSADFNGNSIFLIGGNGSTIANSSSLFVIRSDTNFAADAPLFSASISLDDGNVLLGAIGGTNTVSPAFDAFQLADIGGDVIPEPGVSILALFSAGLLVLRRRR